jgi:hypothetical protein
MSDEPNRDSEQYGEDGREPREESWQPPAILRRGRIEAKLFSDEPDPWGP